jgi:hypothetical protein
VKRFAGKLPSFTSLKVRVIVLPPSTTTIFERKGLPPALLLYSIVDERTRLPDFA